MNEGNESAHEQGPITFEEQRKLAIEMLDAADDRNQFVDRQGGFEDFAAVHQHVEIEPGVTNRDVYDRLENKYIEARKKFDEYIPNKKAFTDELRKNAQKGLADRIDRMFTR